MAARLPTPVAVETGGGMYESEARIHPREIDGRFQRLRTLAVFWLLGMFYLFPWLTWDGRQAVLFDLPARKFFVFGLSFWPQDFIYLALLMMMAAFSLFFFTAIAGRLWCGYACPQTVWTEVFLWLQRITEGRRNQRIKLDAAPMSWDKFRRKFAKQFLWITFALWTGFTFVGFFTPIRTLASEAIAFRMGPWETFWTFFYAFATYGNAGYLREQVCKYMCPYARFQGAMFDRNTLVISYDEARGEPRGSRKRSVPSVLALAAGAERTVGDCIDCKACVHVCPTGIDIRNGLQYECIACGACVDACDEVMDKMSYPRGLVRYTTQNAVEGKPSRILRPRVLVYGGILVALLTGFTWSVTHRVPLIVDVLRDRNALYRLAADGSVENGYTLKLINKRDAQTRYRIEVEGAPALALAGAPIETSVAAGEVGNVAVTLRAAAGALRGKSEVVFAVVGADDATIRYRQKSSFFAPQ